MRKYKTCLSFILIFLCISCGTVQRLTATKAEYLRNFTLFIEDMKKDYPTYDESDWEKAGKKYDIFTGREYEYYEGTYTEEEKEEIGRLKGAYAKIKIKKTANAAKEGLKDFISTGKGVLKGLWE